MSELPLDKALDLMRRLPPKDIEKNLNDLIDLQPDLCEDLLVAVDQPLKTAKDDETGKEYLLCEFNRDGDSYRSPWSNAYYPPLKDGQMPSDELRLLEIQTNKAFETFREMYYDSAISSVYFWKLEDSIACAVLIKCLKDGTQEILGSWDSIHVVEIKEKSFTTAHYKLSSTVVLWFETNKPLTGTMNLSGSLSRQSEKDAHFNDPADHIQTIGKMIEEMENRVRNHLYNIYFGKTKDVVNSLRSIVPLAEEDEKRRNVKDINTEFLNLSHDKPQQ